MESNTPESIPLKQRRQDSNQHGDTYDECQYEGSRRKAETAWSKKNIVLIVGSVLTLIAVSMGIGVGVTKGKGLIARDKYKYT